MLKTLRSSLWLFFLRKTKANLRYARAHMFNAVKVRHFLTSFFFGWRVPWSSLLCRRRCEKIAIKSFRKVSPSCAGVQSGRRMEIEELLVRAARSQSQDCACTQLSSGQRELATRNTRGGAWRAQEVPLTSSNINICSLPVHIVQIILELSKHIVDILKEFFATVIDS